MNSFNWDKAFAVDFDLKTGLSEKAEATARPVSKMISMFQDQAAAEEMVKAGDPCVYDFYELGCPERVGDLAFGTTRLYSGKVGNEYFMTKGHFHTNLMTSEVYYTLSGHGYMMMENMEGDWMAEELRPGEVMYVPRGYAHRMINTGEEELVTFFAFDADAGHDYGTIETKGYRHIIVEENGKPVIKENPRWSEE